MQTAEVSDADLVAGSLDGDREAFRRMVERYQTLICSLAYSATGDTGLSEDIAQEVFVTAWQDLGQLREPAKLRSWLCQIARFRLSKEFRKQGREPVCRAETLESMGEGISLEPLPTDCVINDEEKAILWRSLERIPEIYREPLILFYREHQSVEAVARDLDLSEDAVKQRLSRGRRLLQEQLMAFVEGALRQTGPGQAFTVGVLAALPLLITTAKAATVTAAASKGGSAAKAAVGGGVFAAMLSGAGLVLLSLFGVFGLTGRWVGREMGLASRHSAQARKRTVQFWRTLALGFAVCVLPTFLITHSMRHAHPWLFDLSTWMIVTFYFVTTGALAIWAWQRRRDDRPPAGDSVPAKAPTDRAYAASIALGTLGPALVVAAFAYATFFSDWTLSAKRISSDEAKSIISERADARLTLLQYRDGTKWLDIRLPENGRADLSLRLDDSLVSAIAAKGRAYTVLVEDLDFHNGGFQGWLVLLCMFITVAGVALLLRRPGTRKFHAQDAATPRAERREKRIFAVVGALGMTILSGLLLLMTVAHAGRHITAVEARDILAAEADARLDVYQFSDGTKELWITPTPGWRYPKYIAPGDDATMAFIAERGVLHHTYVQGRDFGYRGPAPWLALTGSFLLAAGASALVWCTIRSRPQPSTATATPS